MSDFLILKRASPFFDVISRSSGMAFRIDSFIMGQADIVRLLLTRGANVFSKDKDG